VVSVAAADHSQAFSGLPVDEDGDVTVTTSEAGFVDHQDPAAAPTPGGHHQIQPSPHQGHDVMPGQVVAAGHLPDREVVDVTDDLAGQTTGQRACGDR
jgi:hypothetical protein